MNLTELDGAAQALFKLEGIYGLYPTEVDGHIHFVFRDSVALEDFQKNPDIALAGIGAMLQQRVRSFLKACAQHDAGELSDADYALWKSKFPAFMEDFQNGACGEDGDGEIDPVPISEPKFPERSRKRKINNGRQP